MQKKANRTVQRIIRRIRKLCKSVEMYVMRINNSGHHHTSKPCERCAHQLSLLGFRKIYYLDSDNCIHKGIQTISKTSWGLTSLRKQTPQVARTISSSKCVSYSSGSDTDE